MEARYIVSADEKGHAKYRSVHAKSYTEVKKKRQEAVKKLTELDYVDQPKAGTVKSVADVWLRDCSHKWKESNALNIRLISENRLDDLRRAATDIAYQSQLLRELFPRKAH